MNRLSLGKAVFSQVCVSPCASLRRVGKSSSWRLAARSENQFAQSGLADVVQTAIPTKIQRRIWHFARRQINCCFPCHDSRIAIAIVHDQRMLSRGKTQKERPPALTSAREFLTRSGWFVGNALGSVFGRVSFDGPYQPEDDHEDDDRDKGRYTRQLVETCAACHADARDEPDCCCGG